MRKAISIILIVIGICMILFGLIGCVSGFSGSGDYEVASYHKVYKGSDGWYHGNDVDYLREKPNNSDMGVLGFFGMLFGSVMTIVGVAIKPKNDNHPEN